MMRTMKRRTMRRRKMTMTAAIAVEDSSVSGFLILNPVWGKWHHHHNQCHHRHHHHHHHHHHWYIMIDISGNKTRTWKSGISLFATFKDFDCDCDLHVQRDTICSMLVLGVMTTVGLLLTFIIWYKNWDCNSIYLELSKREQRKESLCRESLSGGITYFQRVEATSYLPA